MKSIGTILPRQTLLLTKTIGSASRGGITFEVLTDTNHAPVIRCKETGKWFALSWSDIITAAEQAGIDQDDRASRTNHGAPIRL